MAIILAMAPLCLGQPWPLDSPVPITKVVVPIYLKFESEPVAIFRAERFSSDYQTEGFFRIGALPLTVAEDLSVELEDPARLPMALLALAARFAAKDIPKKVVEGHNFTPVVIGRLSA